VTNFPKSQVTHLDQRPVSDRRVAGSGQYRIDQSAHLRPLFPLANPGLAQSGMDAGLYRSVPCARERRFLDEIFKPLL
jgi:hypothetical protein